MDEAPSEEQGIPAVETPPDAPEAQRSFLTDVGLFAAGALTSDVVSDAYGYIKDAAKDGWAKLRDRGKDQEPGPPEADRPP